MKYILLFLILMVPMSAAFAETGDCWFILCWFATNDKSTPEEIYVKAAQNGRERTINSVNNQISELEENSKTISDAQKSGIISGADKLIDASNERADFLQKLIDEENYVRNNPGQFLTQSDLVDRAMNYYKIKPDGTPCDEDRRWVEDTCRPMKRAHKAFYTWDLEWLRDHPELD